MPEPEMPDSTEELLPEWSAFRAAIAEADPEQATACASWTVRDLVVHQTGNAVEHARILTAHLDRQPVPPTRSFEEREAPYRRTADWRGALETAVDRVARVVERALDEPEAWVPWTGRHMKAAWFGEHMRSELVLHRWDVIGDDAISTGQLAQPWMLQHAVEAVGTPLLRAGAARMGGEPFTGRLRVPDQPDVVLTGGAEPGISLAEASGEADLSTDAAARLLLLWGRQPADPSRVRSSAFSGRYGRIRTLLSGY